eukprot:3258837-Rhodomonas_salina.3
MTRGSGGDPQEGREPAKHCADHSARHATLGRRARIGVEGVGEQAEEGARQTAARHFKVLAQRRRGGQDFTPRGQRDAHIAAHHEHRTDWRVCSLAHAADRVRLCLAADSERHRPLRVGRVEVERDRHLVPRPRERQRPVISSIPINRKAPTLSV